MDLVKELIRNHAGKFGEFTYYELHIYMIKHNLDTYPDIAIETCKALVEGISKTILLRLDKTLNYKDLKDWQFYTLFAKSIEKLGEESKEFESGYIEHLRHPIKVLGEIRNSRGDISHGKSTPKLESSSKEFAKFIEEFTTSVVVYILKSFFALNIVEDLEIIYEDNIKFNNTLDENYPLDGYIKYSKALYSQDLTSYLQQLLEFQDNEKEMEDSSGIFSTLELQEVSSDKGQEHVFKDEKLNTSNIIDEYYTKFFDTEKKKHILITLCEENDLYINQVLKIIETYKFDQRDPLKDDIINAMKNKPKLLERQETIPKVKEKIFSYINEYMKEDI